MLQRTIWRFGRGEKGQDYVEFAVILLPLMLMIMGLVDFGRVFNAWLMITHEAREGARYTAVGRGYAEVEEGIRDRLENIGFKNPVDVYFDPASASDRTPGQPVTVTVSTTVQLISKPLTNLFGIDSYSLGSVAAMRYEGDYVSPP